MKTEFNEWEFIEANLPDYSSNEDVALSDDLAKYINRRVSPALRATDCKCPHCFFVVAEAESPPKRRYAIGRSNPPDGYATDKYHTNPYFACVPACTSGTRMQWIAELK